MVFERHAAFVADPCAGRISSFAQEAVCSRKIGEQHGLPHIAGHGETIEYGT